MLQNLAAVLFAFVAGASVAVHFAGAAWWKGAAVAAAGAAALLAARAVPGIDTTIPFLVAVLGAGATGTVLGLTAQQTGMAVAGGAVAAAVPGLLLLG